MHILHRSRTLIMVALILLLALSACMPQATSTTSAPAPTQKPADAVSTPEQVSTPTAVDPDFEPTARPGMEASDPASVALASGGYQLVEFFAFW